MVLCGFKKKRLLQTEARMLHLSNLWMLAQTHTPVKVKTVKATAHDSYHHLHQPSQWGSDEKSAVSLYSEEANADLCAPRQLAEVWRVIRLAVQLRLSGPCWSTNTPKPQRHQLEEKILHFLFWCVRLASKPWRLWCRSAVSHHVWRCYTGLTVQGFCSLFLMLVWLLLLWTYFTSLSLLSVTQEPLSIHLICVRVCVSSHTVNGWQLLLLWSAPISTEVQTQTFNCEKSDRHADFMFLRVNGSSSSSDPTCCAVVPGQETLLEICKGRSGLGLSIVGGRDTQLVTHTHTHTQCVTLQSSAIPAFVTSCEHQWWSNSYYCPSF